MGLKSKVSNITKSYFVPHFYVNSVTLLSHNRMSQVTHKIEIYIAFLLYNAIYIIVQFFKSRFRRNLLFTDASCNVKMISKFGKSEAWELVKSFTVR